MTYYNERKRELKDEKIVAALRQAADDYENGEISEVQGVLVDIVNAISAFERDY